ncbi:MAG: hypothetical protein R2851_04165 [Caldilineaceae bacterium]
MFSFSRISLLVFMTGVYFLIVGIRLLPNRESSDSVAERFALKSSWQKCDQPGESLHRASNPGAPNSDAAVEHGRRRHRREQPRLDAAPNLAVQSGDVLLVKTTTAQLAQMSTVRSLSIDPFRRNETGVSPDLGLWW